MTRLVKWKGDDGGWRTGTLICEAVHVGDVTDQLPYSEKRRLVREAHDGALTWVRHDLLEAWETRDKWEAA